MTSTNEDVQRWAGPLASAVYLQWLFSSLVYFEIYGCQMNKSDAEIAWSVLQSAGFQKTENLRTVGAEAG